MSILYLTQDLLFSSRVTGLARQAGIPVTVVGSLEQLKEKLSESTRGVLIDLEHRAAGDLPAILELLRTVPSQPRTIAYGPHVKTQLLENARTAGVAAVLSRGEFDKQIGTLLQSLSES